MRTQGCRKIPLECIPDVCCLYDLEGTGWFRYKREELIGKRFLDLNLLSLEQIPRVNALLAKNALGEDTGLEEFVFKRKGSLGHSRAKRTSREDTRA